MKYKYIIQEMKESGSPAMRAFVHDMEKIGKLTSKQRHYYLENRQMPDAVNILVKDFIPYTVRIAYRYRRCTKMMTMLDLINEGVFGTYAALKKREGSGMAMTRYINAYIRYYIRHSIYNYKSQN